MGIFRKRKQGESLAERRRYPCRPSEGCEQKIIIEEIIGKRIFKPDLDGLLMWIS